MGFKNASEVVLRGVQYYDIKKTSRMLNLSVPTIRKWRTDGKIGALKYKNQLWFSLAEIIRIQKAALSQDEALQKAAV